MIKWIRASEWLPEFLIFASLFLIGSGADLLIHQPIAVLPGALFAGTIFFTRRVEFLAPVLIVAATMLQIWLQTFPLLTDLATLIVVFLQAALASKVYRTITVLVSVFSSFTWITFALVEGFGASAFNLRGINWFTFVLAFLVAAAVNAVAFSLGRLLIIRSIHVGTDFDRAKMLHKQAHLSVEVARQTERLGIARDLTDLLVQRISAVVSLAEGATFAMKADPEAGPRTIQKVLDSAKSAQVELRRLYDMLHEDRALSAAPPRIEDIEPLVLAMRELGFHASLSVDGKPYPIEEGAHLCVYKIVLEALENVKKHTVVGTEVTVDFFWTEEGLQVLIKDNGIETDRRTSAPDLQNSSAYTAEQDFDALVEKIDGATLSVLSERAALYEGTIEATRVPGVGFTLSALFPHLKAVAGI